MSGMDSPDTHVIQASARVYHSNMQSKQLQESLTLSRTSLVGLNHIPTLVSVLSSTIIFFFKDNSNDLLHAYAPASCRLVPTTTNPL